MDIGKIDEFLQHSLDGQADNQWFSALIEVAERAWEPPDDVREEVRITSWTGNIAGASLTKRAICALSDDAGVVRIEGSR